MLPGLQKTFALINKLFYNLGHNLKAEGYILNAATSDHHAQVLCMDCVNNAQKRAVGGNSLVLKQVFSKNKINYFRHELHNKH